MEHTLARLELHFVGESEPLLAKICLFHSALSSSPIIRLSFPTSAGVRAVCLLFLTSVEQQLLGLPDEAFPVKVHRYLAPVWAACKKRKVKWPDKFLGLDSGIPILHRLLKARGKSKSAKQRFDSRAVKLNTEFIPRKGIELFWQSNRVDQIEGVQELLKKFQEAIIKPDSRPILKSANRLEVAQPLKTLRRWESDELKLVKETIFSRLGQECPRADRLISWAEFLPCSLETDEFMRGHHESLYRDVMEEESAWKDIVPSFNESGAARRAKLERECAEGKRNWTFVHMMFQSDLERIARGDETEYKRCSPRVKEGLFAHLLQILDNPNMNVKLGYVPTDKEWLLKRSKWKGWWRRYDSVVRVELAGKSLFSFARDQDWRMRELTEPERARAWLNAVSEKCEFDHSKIRGLLGKLRMKCTPGDRT